MILQQGTRGTSKNQTLIFIDLYLCILCYLLVPLVPVNISTFFIQYFNNKNNNNNNNNSNNSMILHLTNKEVYILKVVRKRVKGCKGCPMYR